MTYHYEKNTIKRYKRKTKNGTKEFNQVNLGYDSKFETEENIIVISEKDFNEILSKAKTINDYELDIEKLNTHINQLESKYDNKISEMDAENKASEKYINALTWAIAELNSRSFIDRLRNKKPKLYVDIVEKIPKQISGKIDEIEVNQK